MAEDATPARWWPCGPLFWAAWKTLVAAASNICRTRSVGDDSGLASLKTARAVSAARRLALSPLPSPPTPSATMAMLPAFCSEIEILRLPEQQKVLVVIANRAGAGKLEAFDFHVLALSLITIPDKIHTLTPGSGGHSACRRGRHLAARIRFCMSPRARRAGCPAPRQAAYPPPHPSPPADDNKPGPLDGGPGPLVRCILSLGSIGRLLLQEHRPVNHCAAFPEVDHPVDAPQRRHPQGDIRLLPAHPADRERADQVEQHAARFASKPKTGTTKCLNPLKLWCSRKATIAMTQVIM